MSGKLKGEIVGIGGIGEDGELTQLQMDERMTKLTHDINKLQEESVMLDMMMSRVYGQAEVSRINIDCLVQMMCEAKTGDLDESEEALLSLNMDEIRRIIGTLENGSEAIKRVLCEIACIQCEARSRIYTEIDMKLVALGTSAQVGHHVDLN